MSEVQIRINDNKGAFYIDVEGKKEAMMTFVFADEDKIIIDHTEVNTGNEGKGFGKKMIQYIENKALEAKNTSIQSCANLALGFLPKAMPIRFDRGAGVREVSNNPDVMEGLAEQFKAPKNAHVCGVGCSCQLMRRDGP